ncbi:hypothetical protein G7048_03905 [Diaphorobacter sp. HDW4B]|uniref:hypothetical protein n=1 Tax=Diaphorobacter sp. HDW4B TaxID=2714925 RepID=UPI001409BC8E|nr:hypothetical protein [Diaphorobacter sp. HDW4B]QIL69590.1 hypothetical protein G7048_03905 [Diaphorobacter sp. HDW4B]
MSNIAPSTPTPVTMTSLEIVDFINDLRKEDAHAAGAAFPSQGFAKLEHSDFMKKVPEVLEERAGIFSATYQIPGPNSSSRTAPCYRFPKREASLMAMSYSYKIQAKVWDHMTALEEKLNSRESAALEQSTKPARVRGRTPLEQVKIINFVGDALKDVPGVRLGRIAAAKLKAFAEQTGLDFSDFRRALPPLPLDQMVHLNPTQIGARVGELTGRGKISGQAVNKILLSLGLQRRVEDGYVLTEAGTKYGEIHDYKAENDHSGLQIDWYESVVSLVRDNLPEATGKSSKRSMKLRPGPGEPRGAMS